MTFFPAVKCEDSCKNIIYMYHVQLTGRLSFTGGEGGGEGRAPADPAAARDGRRGGGGARGQGQGHRRRGRDEGLGRAQGRLGHHIDVAGGAAAEVPADADQHLGREELHHHLSPANRDAEPD